MKQKIKSIVIETVLLGRIVFFFYRIKIVSGYLLGLLPDFMRPKAEHHGFTRG